MALMLTLGTVAAAGTSVSMRGTGETAQITSDLDWAKVSFSAYNRAAREGYPTLSRVGPQGKGAFKISGYDLSENSRVRLNLKFKQVEVLSDTPNNLIVSATARGVYWEKSPTLRMRPKRVTGNLVYNYNKNTGITSVTGEVSGISFVSNEIATRVL